MGTPAQTSFIATCRTITPPVMPVRAARAALERGGRSWAPTIDGLVWLAENGFSINVASRYLLGEPEAVLRRGFA